MRQAIIRFYVDQRSVAQAENHLQYLNLPPESAQFTSLLKGDLYSICGEYDAAIVEYCQACDIAPNWFWPFYRIAEVYSLIGKNTEAIEAFRQGRRILKKTSGSDKYRPLLGSEQMEENKELAIELETSGPLSIFSEMVVDVPRSVVKFLQYIGIAIRKNWPYFILSLFFSIGLEIWVYKPLPPDNGNLVDLVLAFAIRVTLFTVVGTMLLQEIYKAARETIFFHPNIGRWALFLLILTLPFFILTLVSFPDLLCGSSLFLAYAIAIYILAVLLYHSPLSPTKSNFLRLIKVAIPITVLIAGLMSGLSFLTMMLLG